MTSDNGTDDPPRRRLRLTVWARLARFSTRHAVAVAGMLLLCAVAALGLVVSRFAIDSDPRRLSGVGVELARDYRALSEAFPALWEPLSAVVVSAQPGRAKATAALLGRFLESRPDLFTSVFVPGTGPFFEDYGLLYLETETVGRIVRRIEQSAPLFQAVTASPDLRGFAELSAQVARAVSEGRSPEGLEGLFEEAARTVEAQAQGQPRVLDWPGLVETSAQIDTSRTYIEAAAVADFRSLHPFTRPLAELRIVAAQLESQSGGKATISIAGPETGTQADIAGAAAIPALVATVVILVVLGFGLTRLRLGFAVGLTAFASIIVSAGLVTAVAGPWVPAGFILMGLVLALACACCLIVACHYELETVPGAPNGAALVLTGQRAGPGLAVLSGSAALALPVFLFAQPTATPLLGVLGAAACLLAALLAATLLPALIRIFEAGRQAETVHWLDAAVDQHGGRRWRIARIVLLILLVAAPFAAIPLLVAVEAARSYSPAPMHVLSAPGAPARELARRLSALPGVASVTFVDSFLPQEEQRKRDMLARLRDLVPIAPAAPLPPEVDALRTDFDRLQENLQAISTTDGVGFGLAEAAHRLRRACALFDAPEPAAPGALLRLERALYARLPVLLERIDRMGRLAPLSVERLDEAVRRRFVAPDGRWRLEIVPRPEPGAMEAIRAVAPQAVNLEILRQAQAEALEAPVWIAAATALSALGLLTLGAVRSWRAALVATVPVGATLAAMLVLCRAAAAPSNPIDLLAPALAVLLTAAAAASYAAQAGRAAWHRCTVLTVALALSATAALALSPIPPLADLGRLASLGIAVHLAIALIVIPQLGQWFLPTDADWDDDA